MALLSLTITTRGPGHIGLPAPVLELLTPAKTAAFGVCDKAGNPVGDIAALAERAN
jgi:hypothetical protein